MKYWRGYLSGARYKLFAYGPTEATATPSSLASLKSRLVQPFWCRLMQVVTVVLGKEAVKQVSVCSYLVSFPTYNKILIKNCKFLLLHLLVVVTQLEFH